MPRTGLGGRPPPASSMDSATPQNSGTRYVLARPRLFAQLVEDEVASSRVSCVREAAVIGYETPVGERRGRRRALGHFVVEQRVEAVGGHRGQRLLAIAGADHNRGEKLGLDQVG